MLHCMLRLLCFLSALSLGLAVLLLFMICSVYIFGRYYMATKIIEVGDHEGEAGDQTVHYGNLRPKMWKDGKPRIFVGPQRKLTVTQP